MRASLQQWHLQEFPCDAHITAWKSFGICKIQKEKAIERKGRNINCKEKQIKL